MVSIRHIFGGTLLGLVAGGAAMAAKPPPTTAPAVQAVVDCRRIADNDIRLQCYDAAVATLGQAEQSGDLVSLDREQRRTVRRQAFGFSLPSLSMLDRGEKQDEISSMNETVATASQLADGKWVMRMQDGAVWRQIDDDWQPSRYPHAGSSAVIKRAALGRFLLDADGKP